MSSELRKYSPVICWRSVWKKDKMLHIKEMNKQCRNYQKALDMKAQEQVWKQ